MDTIKQGDEAVGNHVKARVVKNKVAPPFRSAEFDIMFDHGISREGNLIDLSAELGLVSKSGAFFSYGDVRLGQGRENAKQFLRQHPEIAQDIEGRIRASAGGHQLTSK
jgi:recombination protein RecA